MRQSDFGVNDQTYFVNCHLGDLIDYNDTVLGYDIEQANCTEFEEFITTKRSKYPLPEIIIVKKTLSKKSIKRIWKLKHLDKKIVEDE